MQGELRVSGVTGRMEPDYPAWRRNLTRYLVTVPVVLCCLLVVFVVMLLILQLQVGWWVSWLARLWGSRERDVRLNKGFVGAFWGLVVGISFG